MENDEVRVWWEWLSSSDVVSGAYRGLDWDELPCCVKKVIQDMWDLTHTSRGREEPTVYHPPSP